MTLENEGRDTQGGGGGAIFAFNMPRLASWHPYLTIKSILWSTIDPNLVMFGISNVIAYIITLESLLHVTRTP